jgi:hypothetical protein
LGAITAPAIIGVGTSLLSTPIALLATLFAEINHQKLPKARRRVKHFPGTGPAYPERLTKKFHGC